MSGILQRSILAELFKVFIPALIGITGLIVMATVVKEAADSGFSPTQIFAMVALIIPSMMPFIIPPTTLFAACVVFGRLSHDSEITAIKSAGISVLQVIWPGAILGLSMSAALFALYCYVIPYSHHILRTAVANDAEEYIYAVLKKDHEIRKLDLHLNWEILVEQVHGRQLRNATFKRRDAKNHYDVIARAREAELHVDTINREVIVRMRHCEALDEAGKNRAYFEERDYAVALPEMDKNRKFSTREMTWNQLLDDRKEAIKSLEDVAKQANDLNANANASNLPARSYLQMEKKRQEERVRMVDAEMQQRPALACGCFFFVIIGCPVGIWFSRSDYLSAFISCFLPVVFIYYPVYLCFTSFAKNGKMNLVAGHWMANLVLAVIALGLFRKLLKN